MIVFSNSVRVFFDFNYPAIIIFPKISRRLYILYLYLYKKYLCHCKCNYMLVKELNRFSKVEKGYASGSCWCVRTFYQSQLCCDRFRKEVPNLGYVTDDMKICIIMSNGSDWILCTKCYSNATHAATSTPLPCLLVPRPSQC